MGMEAARAGNSQIYDTKSLLKEEVMPLEFKIF